ncbi:stonustoxin subunit beta-like [Pagrus major]|uniref:stonustoxin subunit beta-like n=1 Tax=Pagrus major TaxID=143350 RepID=UPI003CC89CC5
MIQRSPGYDDPDHVRQQEPGEADVPRGPWMDKFLPQCVLSCHFKVTSTTQKQASNFSDPPFKPTADACELTLDPNTAHRRLKLSEDNKRGECLDGEEEQHYSFHPERFNCCKQVLCRNSLTGRCYWEIETKGNFDIAVTYRGISRRGSGYDCKFGGNDKSWSLQLYHWYYLCHNNTETKTRRLSKDSKKVAVYLDWPAGSLSFYTVHSDTLEHVYTVYSRFTEPLYPGFGFESGRQRFSYHGSALSLCQKDEETESVTVSTEF